MNIKYVRNYILNSEEFTIFNDKIQLNFEDTSKGYGMDY